jgi:hypothetical protein
LTVGAGFALNPILLPIRQPLGGVSPANHADASVHGSVAAKAVMGPPAAST